MNAFKRYLHNKGVKLEQDYDSLPHYLPNNITIEDIQMDATHAVYRVYYNVVGWVYNQLNRDGTITQTECYYDIYNDDEFGY